MITHREAEALISARLDQPLDPIAERALSAHLATCPDCRAFARSSDALAMGLRELPYLPASSAVSRRVMARIDEGRSPWARFGGLLNTNPGPALSTFAVIAVLFLLGFFVLNRFVLDDRGGADQGNTQLASQPTALPTQSASFTISGTAEPTQETEATETLSPTEAPTATKAPTNAPTDAPTNAPTETDVPEPTATEPPPTETPVPTEPPTTAPTEPPTKEPQPTATEETTSLRLASDEESTPGDIVDLTSPEVTDVVDATATPYEEPTAADVPAPTATSTTEPTATLEPTATQTLEPTATATLEPTATATVEPTATVAPTETPTVESTATLEPTATATEQPTEEGPPPILPIDGGEVVEAPEDAEATSTPDASTKVADEQSPTPAPTEADVAIEPIEGTGQAGEGDGAGGQTIEPAGEATATSTPTDGNDIQPIESDTPEKTVEATATEATGDNTTLDLESSSESYGDIAGEQGGRLILDGGRMEYGAQAHPVVTTSVSEFEAQTVQAENGQAVAICAPGGDCTDLTSASSEGPAIDEPLGWIDDGLIYVRTEGNVISYHYLVPGEGGTEVLSDEVLIEGGSELAPTQPLYQAEGRIWVITTGGDWLSLTPDGGQRLPNRNSAPQDLRFAATGNRGLLVGYVSNGQLIIAPGDQPGSPLLVLPFSGVDFDIAPGGDQVVVSTGAAIEIYGLDGTLVTTYASEGMQPGTVLWLNSGIVFVDTASGALLQIPDPQH